VLSSLLLVVIVNCPSLSTANTPFPPPPPSSAFACLHAAGVDQFLHAFPIFPPFPSSISLLFFSPHSSHPSLLLLFDFIYLVSSSFQQDCPAQSATLVAILLYLCVLVSTAIPSLLIPKLLIVETTLPHWRWFRAQGHSRTCFFIFNFWLHVMTIKFMVDFVTN
jgi:hypothetical protein